MTSIFPKRVAIIAATTLVVGFLIVGAVWIDSKDARCPAVTVVVSNEGPSPVSELSVCLGERCARRNRLRAQRSWNADVVPAAESSIVVSYRDGEAHRAELDAYVEPGSSGTLEVVLADRVPPTVRTRRLSSPGDWRESLCEPGPADS